MTGWMLSATMHCSYRARSSPRCWESRCQTASVYQSWSAAWICAACFKSPGLLRASGRSCKYIRKLVRMRHRRPENDLISALTAAQEAGDKLNEDELLAMIVLLLIAGYETINLIGNGTALLENPAET